MSDYAVSIKVRNGRILRRMRARGIVSVSELARRAGMHTTIACSLVALKQSPVKKDGGWISGIENIAGVLGCNPEDLFTDAQMTMSLEANTSEAYMDEAAVMQLASGDPEQSAWAKIEAQRLLENLGDRERRIVEMRMDGHEVKEIAKIFDITGARVRKIEENAMRKMKAAHHRLDTEFASNLVFGGSDR